MFEKVEGGRAGCHIPSFCWEKAWHSHHPYKKMPTSVLPPCSWKRELPIAGTKASTCFLKQMILFHLSLCKIKLSPFHQGCPGLPGTLSPSKNQVSLASTTRSGKVEPSWVLSAAPSYPGAPHHSIRCFATGSGAGFLPLPGVWGQSVYLGA